MDPKNYCAIQKTIPNNNELTVITETVNKPYSGTECVKEITKLNVNTVLEVESSNMMMSENVQDENETNKPLKLDHLHLELNKNYSSSIYTEEHLEIPHFNKEMHEEINTADWSRPKNDEEKLLIKTNAQVFMAGQTRFKVVDETDANNSCGYPAHGGIFRMTVLNPNERRVVKPKQDRKLVLKTVPFDGYCRCGAPSEQSQRRPEPLCSCADKAECSKKYPLLSKDVAERKTKVYCEMCEKYYVKGTRHRCQPRVFKIV